MEGYWAALNFVSAILNLFINSIVLGIFFKPFFKNKKCVTSVTMAYFVTMLVMYLMPFEVNSAFAYLVGILALFVAAATAERGNTPQKIFLSVLSYLIRWIAGGIRVIPWNFMMSAVVNHPKIPQGTALQLMLFGMVTLFLS